MPRFSDRNEGGERRLVGIRLAWRLETAATIDQDKYLMIATTLVKSDLKFPDELYTALTIYPLFASGLKGGMKLNGMSYLFIQSGQALGSGQNARATVARAFCPPPSI